MIPDLTHNQFQTNVFLFVKLFDSYSEIFYVGIFGHLIIKEYILQYRFHNENKKLYYLGYDFASCDKISGNLIKKCGGFRFDCPYFS